ncbi:hypothetical protein [Carboxydothermus ferrireducens]|nr:hypothetical protein [Carboxydothermus ferrireducens]
MLEMLEKLTRLVIQTTDGLEALRTEIKEFSREMKNWRKEK